MSSPPPPAPDPTPDDAAEADEIARRAASTYWRQNLKAVAILLSIWAIVSYGCGILFADWLNQFTLPFSHFPLGFWFAQQGSMYVFVILILIYVRWMTHLDRNYHPREVLKAAKLPADATTPAGEAAPGARGDEANPAANI